MKPERRKLLSRVLVVFGGVAMLVGAMDPLEGWIAILPACGLVTLGAFTGQEERSHRLYWLWLFIAMAFGVAAMIALSAWGGLGGRRGHSLWWGLLILPYPIAWLLAMARLVVRLATGIRRHATPAS